MNKSVVILGTVVVVGALGFAAYKGLKKERPDISYQTYVVKRGDIHTTILSTGTVSPENRLEIKPPIAGRVETILVQEGVKVRKGQVLAWMSSTERAALLDAATSQGPAALKEWEDLYKPTPILAPINGTIILRNVESGQTFTSADSVFTMSDRLTVKAQVDETDMSQVRLKQKAMISLDAYPKEKIPAIVDQIAFDAKTVSNVTTYLVDVLPVQTPDYMRSGMTANVTFDIEDKENVLVIPSESLKTIDGKMVVLIPGQDPKDPPIEKIVQVGLSDGKRTEITAGLAEEDSILIQEFRLNEKKSEGSSPFGLPSGPKKRK